MSRNTRVVFLDIDGPLAPFCRINSHVLDAACVQRVHQLAKFSTIVLASSHSETTARDWFELPLDAVLDEERKFYDGRPKAIYRYLKSHPEVTSWVSIDDDYIVRTVNRFPADNPVRELLACPERFLRANWIFDESENTVRGSGLTGAMLLEALKLLGAV